MSRYDPYNGYASSKYGSRYGGGREDGSGIRGSGGAWSGEDLRSKIAGSANSRRPDVKKRDRSPNREKTTQNGHRGSDSETKRRRSDRCFRCDGDGHIAAVCPSSTDPSSSTANQTCYLCNGKGHIQKICPNNTDPETCYTCGMPGHLGRDCPNVDMGDGGIPMGPPPPQPSAASIADTVLPLAAVLQAFGANGLPSPADYARMLASLGYNVEDSRGGGLPGHSGGFDRGPPSRLFDGSAAMLPSASSSYGGGGGGGFGGLSGLAGASSSRFGFSAAGGPSPFTQTRSYDSAPYNRGELDPYDRAADFLARGAGDSYDRYDRAEEYERRRVVDERDYAPRGDGRRDRDRDRRGGRDRERDYDRAAAHEYPQDPFGGSSSSDTCFRCGKPGHWARDCPGSSGGGASSAISSRQQPAPDRREGCYKCGREGHFARDCDGGSTGGGGGSSSSSGPVCYNCKRSGHIAKDCPSRR